MPGKEIFLKQAKILLDAGLSEEEIVKELLDSGLTEKDARTILSEIKGGGKTRVKSPAIKATPEPELESEPETESEEAETESEEPESLGPTRFSDVDDSKHAATQVMLDHLSEQLNELRSMLLKSSSTDLKQFESRILELESKLSEMKGTNQSIEKLLKDLLETERQILNKL